MADKPTTPGYTRDEMAEQEAYNARLAETERRQKELALSLEARLNAVKELAPIELSFLQNVNDLLVKERLELQARKDAIEETKSKINALINSQMGLNQASKEGADNAKKTLETTQQTTTAVQKMETAISALSEEQKRDLETQRSILEVSEKRIGAIKVVIEQKEDELKLEEQKLKVAQERERQEIDSSLEKMRADLEARKTSLSTFEAEKQQAEKKIKTLIGITTSTENQGKAEERVAAAVGDTLEGLKTKLAVQMHNARATEIDLKTQEKLLGIGMTSYRLQDSFIGSFTARMKNEEKSIKNLISMIGSQFNNSELAFGTMFKKIEDGLNFLSNKFISFVNFEKDLVLGADKAAAAFNKTTGRGEEFRKVITSINKTNDTSIEKFTEFNIGLDRVESGFADLYTSYNKFRDIATNPEPALKFVLTAQKLNNLGLSVQKFGSLATSLGGSIAKTTDDAKDLGEALVQTMLATGKSMESLAGDFESFKDRFVVYGKTGVQVFKDLQIMAERMGLSFSSLVGATTAFDKFEEGAKRAGQINAALGGAYVNSLDLMNMKENERILYLKRSFEQSGMSFKSLNKYSQEFVASAFGIKSVAEAHNLFSMSTAALSLQLEERNKKQKEFDDIAKNSADAMEKIKLSFQNLLVGFGPAIEFLSKAGEIVRNNATAFKIIIGGLLGVGGAVFVISSLAKIFVVSKSIALLVMSLYNKSGLTLKDILTTTEQHVAQNTLLGKITNQRLEQEKRITAERERQAALSRAGGAVPISNTPAGTQTAATPVVPISAPQQNAVTPTGFVNPQQRAFLGTTGGNLSSVGMMGNMLNLFIEDPRIKRIITGISSLLMAVGGIMSVIALVGTGATLTAFLMPVMAAIGGILGLVSVFKGANLSSDGTIASASDYALKGKPIISAKDTMGNPILAALDEKDVGVQRFDEGGNSQGVTFTREEEVINSGMQLTKNNISNLTNKINEKKVSIQSAAIQNMASSKIQAMNNYSTEIAANSANQQVTLSKEQIQELTKAMYDAVLNGSRLGIENAKVSVDGIRLEIDKKTLFSATTEGLQRAALGRG